MEPDQEKAKRLEDELWLGFKKRLNAIGFKMAKNDLIDRWAGNVLNKFYIPSMHRDETVFHTYYMDCLKDIASWDPPTLAQVKYLLISNMGRDDDILIYQDIVKDEEILMFCFKEVQEEIRTFLEKGPPP